MFTDKNVYILGTQYSIEYREKSCDEILDKDNLDGYTDNTKKLIVITKPYKESKIKDWEYYLKEVLRHEIIHAFLYESGLDWSSTNYSGPWACNEEMVDWFAIQFPKISSVFKDLDIL